MKEKKGQMQLSFGMIFSIILIIVFMAFAFFAIYKFLDIRNSVEVGKFANDFQKDIDSIWKGSQGSQERTYFLDESIKYVCLADFESNKKGSNIYSNYYDELERVYFGKENLFFYPVGSAQGSDSKEIKNIDLIQTTSENNPFCVRNIDGKVKFTIKKDFGEDLVTIIE
ncbi:hypothetical protein HY448_01440 [Candidatus Pacearchaeota archaeon]|nr:hypothetical protein [Candidatus Pacearchaeota archaeon]